MCLSPMAKRSLRGVDLCLGFFMMSYRTKRSGRNRRCSIVVKVVNALVETWEKVGDRFCLGGREPAQRQWSQRLTGRRVSADLPSLRRWRPGFAETAQARPKPALKPRGHSGLHADLRDSGGLLYGEEGSVKVRDRAKMKAETHRNSTRVAGSSIRLRRAEQ